MNIKVHIVLSRGPILHGAYTRSDLAFRHAGCISGADVVACEMRDTPFRLGDIWVVVAPGLILHGAYHAEVGARSLAAELGDVVVDRCELRDTLPETILTDIVHTEFDDDDDTPEVFEVPIGDLDDGSDPG